jgi:hypothetical protein
MHAYIDEWICPEQMDGFYSYSVFESLSIIDRCPININIAITKIYYS